MLRTSTNRRSGGRIALFLLTALALALAFAGLHPGTARAASPIVVNTAADENGTGGSCSLREAIQAANTNGPYGGCTTGSPGADTITFSASLNGQTITISRSGAEDDNNATGDLDIAESVAITGNGASNTIIAGSNAPNNSAIFDTAFAPAGTIVSISALTIRNGNPTGADFQGGGALYVNYDVTANLSNVAIRDSIAPDGGGGIFNNGTLSLTDSTVSTNNTSNRGGGIFSTGGLTVTNSTVSGNGAEKGGGIWASNDASTPITITNSAIAGNDVRDKPGGSATDFGDGAGLYLEIDGSVTITGSKLNGNTASRNGGAVYVRDQSNNGVSGTLTMNYNSIVGNTAVAGKGLYRFSSNTLAYAAAVSAENNWWGCNTYPAAAPCNAAAETATPSGASDVSPWLMLRHTANPASIEVGSTSTLTASFLINSDNQAVAASNLGALVGVPVTFNNAVLGTIANAQPTIQPNGTATATFTAGSTSGAGSADATVDGVTSTASITITKPTTTATITLPAAATNPTNASSVSWTVTFDIAVSGLSSSNFSLVNGGLGGSVNITTISGGPPSNSWMVTASTGTGNGTLGLNLTNDDNLSATVTNITVVGPAYTIDRTTPTADITDVTPDPRNSAVTSIQIVFSEPVSGFDKVDLSLTRGGSPVDLATATLTTNDNVTYTLGNLTALTGTDGTYVLTLTAAESGIADQAGNALATDASDTWVVDTTGPAVTITQAAGQLDPTNASPINFTVTFSKPVADFAADDVTLSGTAGPTTAVVTPVAPNNGTTYNVAVSGMAGDGTVIMTIGAEKAHDALGNPNTASSGGDNTVTYDTTSPTVTIKQAAAQPDPTNASSVTFTVIFNEPVTGFDNNDVVVTGTAQAGTTVTVTPAGRGTTFTVTVGNITANGTIIATIPAGAATDDAGNGNAASTSTDNQVTRDASALNVTINQAAGQADPTNSSPVQFTVVFSKPVSDFTGTDVVLSGTAGATTASVSGGGTTYTVSVSGMIASGTVIATIPAGVAHDAASNANVASTSTDNTVTFDNVAPTVTINQAAGQLDPTGTASISFTVVFSRPVIGFTGSDVVLGGTAGATTASVTGGPSTYTVTVTGMTQSGTVIATIPAGAAQDAVGNPNPASTSTDNTVTYSPGSPCAGLFADVSASDPACAAIAALEQRGVIYGYATQPMTFGPGKPVTRAEMAAFIVRALGWQDRPQGPRTFTDLGPLEGTDLAKAVRIVANACDAQGCVAAGYGDGRFGPNDQVTYAQAISFITRAFRMDPKYAWQTQTSGPLPYNGVPEVHRNDVRTFFYYAGSIPDAPDTSDGWNAQALRGWVARVLYQALSTKP